MSCGCRPSTASFAKIIEPARGLSRPERAFRVVDFPAPLPPIKATISPAGTAKQTFRRTSVAPYQTLSPSTVSIDRLAQIRFDYTGVAGYGLGRAFCDLPTRV